MKNALLICACLLGLAPPTLAAGPEDSVVRVFATVRYPNPLKPWTNGNPVDVLGSGTVIEGKRILTNAHLVLYATDVQIQPRRGGAKIEAKVEMLAPDMDLAVLSVKDNKFFDKHPPLPRANKLPKVQDSVAVYGFPVGGNDLSVTKGVVSRIDFGRYYQQGMGLIVQVSAAINPGNSGGPAVVDDQMIGIVLSRLGGQQNIGYLIPNEEIDLFLKDIADGRYDGKPMEAAGTEFQRCENKALRGYLKLDEETRGMLIIPPRRSPADYPFQEFDLLTKIGPYEIDNDGMVQLPDDLRVSFYNVIDKLAQDNAVPVTLVRQGKRIETAMAVSSVDNRLIRDYRGEKPSYFIHGPLVFSPAKADAIAWYARMRPDLDSLQSPLFTRFTDRVQFPDEELVVVTSPLFAHKITKGYEDPLGQVVTEVNGTKLKNLKHLVEIFRDCADEYLTLRFAEQGAEVLVFQREEMNKATEDILEDNGISPTRRGSEDMLKVWKQPKER
jgi:S1-C subfamily serine protease